MNFTFTRPVYPDHKALGKELADKGLVHYENMDLNAKINLKGLICGDRAISSFLSHRMDREEFDLLKMIFMCSDWRTAINIFLHKWQTK